MSPTISSSLASGPLPTRMVSRVSNTAISSKISAMPGSSVTRSSRTSSSRAYRQHLTKRGEDFYRSWFAVVDLLA